MALLSNMVPLDTPLPEFVLPDLEGNPVSLRDLRGKGVLLVIFACNHCPYVRHVEDALGKQISEFQQDPRFGAVAICSNDVDQYPGDDAAGLRAQQQRAGWTFPYLVDADQRAGLEFHAACTPDFFLYDFQGRLAYRGAFDYSSPKNGEPLTGELLRNAISRTLAGQPVPEPHKPAMGCGIKWKLGNEPE